MVMRKQAGFRWPLRLRAAAIVASATLLALAACDRGGKLPDKASKEYGETAAAFYSGLAAFQVGDDARAESRLGDVTRLAPGEPAGWANWAALALRQRNFELAAQRLDRARDLAPKDARIYYLYGILESQRGNSTQAIAQLRKSVELDPRNTRVIYALEQEIERQGDKNNEMELQQWVQKILVAQPGNLAALLESSRLAARRGDRSGLQSAVAQMSKRAAAWPAEVQEQFTALQAATEGGDLRAAATRTSLLRNVLWRVPEFRRDFSMLKAAPGEDVEPFTRFVRLEAPTIKPAPADTTISFDVQPLSNAEGTWQWVGAIQLGGAGAPVVAVANGNKLQLANGATLVFPGGPAAVAPSPEGVLQLDYNYDFKTDLVLAGAGGVRVFRQETPDTFIDETTRTKLPSDVLNGRYTGAWAADVEADGDLDIVLGTSDAQPVVLRNDGDGTFSVTRLFAGVQGLRQFVWADLDGDGVPDAGLLDAGGHLHVFINERQGRFRERALPPGLTTIMAIAVADANNDGQLDLLALQSDGALVRISVKDEAPGWDVAEIARIPPDEAHLREMDVRLHVADLDNNGAADIYLSAVAAADSAPAGALIWLGNEKGEFKLLERPSGPQRVFDAADLNGDGRLDLLGLAADGQAVQGVNRGERKYHWQIVRPRAAEAFGDQRINPFGVGGEIEIRAGMLLQKQLITGPQVHFGLGEQASTDVVRVVWPNGAVRVEFELKADQEVVTEQRLKGSCPFLFAYDGKQMSFVKDAVPWGSAIGLRINTLGTARVEATEEWYKIGGNELAPRGGYYDLRITAELWETYYYDQLALMTVDHPAATDIFVDERFVIPPAKLAITTVETPHKIAHAVDDSGNDVTDMVSTLDEKYLDNFGRGRYQGVTRDHFVEVDLGPDAPQSGPLWLIAKGWMHPTDSSVNVAISQGQEIHAAPLSMEVPDGKGGWVVAQPNLSFPAGRKKICLFDLANVFRPGTPRRLRLRTN